MRSKQRGVTFIGWVMLMVPIGILAYAGIRLAPIYLNYMKVVRSLEAVQTQFKDGGDTANLSALRASLQRNFDVQSVDYPLAKDIMINRDGHAWVMEAEFTDQAPLFSNVSIQVAFDKTVQIGSE